MNCKAIPDPADSSKRGKAPTLRPRQKRLLILFPSPVRGGAEDYCVTIARGAVSAGWEVHAAFARREAMASIKDDCGALGVRYHPLDVVDVGPRAERAPFLARFTRTWRTLRRIQPSVVLLSLCGVQYGLGPLVTCALCGVPAFVIFHLVRGRYRFAPPAQRMRAWARARGQRYITVSRQNRDSLAEAFCMNPGVIDVISTGADPARFACSEAQRKETRARLRAELGFSEDALLLLSVGRLTPQKGHDLLVPAIAHVVRRYPKARFIWAGDGPLEQDLVALVGQYGVSDYVRLLGRRGDIPELLIASDLFVHPTRYEGQPFSMFEAMAAELPIVTTRASGITEVLEDRVHGLLGRVEDVRDLRENLLYALGHPGEMRAMAERARARLESFTEQAMIDKTLRVLEGLCR